MHMPKPSDADKERFRAVMPADPGITVKPMFGNLSTSVDS